MRQGHDFAVILAGGRGTRLQPLTASRQKCLLMVHRKPLLDWLLQLWSSLGVRHFVVVVNHDAYSVERHIATSVYANKCVVARTSSSTTASAMAELAPDLPPRFIFLHGNVLVSAIDAAAMLAVDRKGPENTLATIPRSSGLTHAVVEYRDATRLQIVHATASTFPLVDLGYDLSLGVGVLTSDTLDWTKASLPGAMVEALINSDDIRGVGVRDFLHVETAGDLAQLEQFDLAHFLWGSPVAHE